MDTMERSTVTDSVTLQLGALNELLTGASTHADKSKSAIPALSTVQLRGEGGLITATATDRYRLIQGTIAGEGDLSVSLIPLDDIKRILALLKGEGAGEYLFTRTYYGYTIKQAKALFKIALEGEGK